MAGGPIVLHYSADISEATKGTDDLAQAVDKVGDAADDSAKASGAATDLMLKDRKDAAKQILAITRDQALREAKEWQSSALAAGQSTEQVERVYQAMVQTIDSSTGKVFSKLNGATTENIGGIERSIVGVRGNLTGMFQQVGVAFDWSDPVGSAASSLQGLASLIPGIGGLIGAAIGGAGFGLISKAFDDASASEKAFRQDIADLANDLIETGSKGGASIGFVVDQLKKMATETDPNALSLKKIHDEAKDLGVPFKDLALAYASGKNQLDAQITSLRKLADQTVKSGQDYGNFGSIMGNSSREGISGIEDQIAALEKVKKKNQEAASEQKQYAETGAAALEAKKEQIENIAKSLGDAAAGADQFYDSQTKSFDTAGYIANWQKLSEEIAHVAQDLAVSNLDDAAKSYIQTLPIEVQAQYIAAYKAANPQQQAALNTIWAENGTDGGKAYVDGLKSSLPTNIAGPEITATWKVDDSALKRAIAAATNIYVPVFISPRAGKQLLP